MLPPESDETSWVEGDRNWKMINAACLFFFFLLGFTNIPGIGVVNLEISVPQSSQKNPSGHANQPSPPMRIFKNEKYNCQPSDKHQQKKNAQVPT